MQKVLDDRIVAEKGLQGVDLLDKKILALLTELGELSNEYRGFKFWSEEQEPRTTSMKLVSYEVNGELINKAEPYNPLLEEYVDCLHFILSIGNDRPLNVGGFELLDKQVISHNINVYTENSITKQFNCIFKNITDYKNDYEQESYEGLILRFISLGEMLGFTTDQIEQAYFEKNKINHERQDTNY